MLIGDFRSNSVTRKSRRDDYDTSTTPRTTLTFTVGSEQDDTHPAIGEPDDLFLDGFEIDLLVVGHGGDQRGVDAIVEGTFGTVEPVGRTVTVGVGRGSSGRHIGFGSWVGSGDS